MFVFIILLICLLLSLYLYLSRNFNYWKDRGIFYYKPTIFVGSLGPIFRLQYSMGEFFAKIYKENPDKRFVGLFLADAPCLLVRDYALASRIMKQDFNYFSRRLFKMPTKTDPLGARSLFSTDGTEWKNSRVKLSPTFTSKKQKVAFDRALAIVDKIEESFKKRTTFELKRMGSCIAADAISYGALRREGEALSNPESDELRRLGEGLFSVSLNQGIRFQLVFMAPEFMKLLKIAVFPKWTYQYMRELIATATAVNDEKHRGDYIDCLLRLREKGPWEGNHGNIINPNDDTLISQMFIFLVAGYETNGSGVIHVIYEAARNQVIQDKLRKEIRDTMAKHEGVMTYEALNELTYVTKFVNECLRKSPPFPFIDRYCTSDYKIPDTNVTIHKGTKVLIPMLALQNDELFYENPEEIIPERFDNLDPEKEKPYFPFGVGPKTCIGMRFALLIMKLALIGCLRNHRLTLTSPDIPVLRMSPKKFGYAPVDDIYVNVYPVI